jgi:hypothetical protein
MLRLYEQEGQQAEREPAGVERDVERRRMPAADEALVQLIGSCVEDPDREGRQHAADRAKKQRPEDRVLGHVRALAQHLVPDAEPARERGDRGEPEDHACPEDDRRPEGESTGESHRGAMIGSRRLGER